MTKKEVRRYALELAYKALQKAADCGGDEFGADHNTQVKVEKELDRLTQAAYDRWQRAIGK